MQHVPTHRASILSLSPSIATLRELSLCGVAVVRTPPKALSAIPLDPSPSNSVPPPDPLSRSWHYTSPLFKILTYFHYKSTMQSARDIPLLITSAASSSERRITPSWSIAQLKAKLESVTGIPPSAQRLLLRTADQQERPIEADDEEHVQVGQWPLIDYAEIHVSSTARRRR